MTTKPSTRRARIKRAMRASHNCGIVIYTNHGSAFFAVPEGLDKLRQQVPYLRNKHMIGLDELIGKYIYFRTSERRTDFGPIRESCDYRED